MRATFRDQQQARTCWPPQEAIITWPPFFQFNKRLLRPKTGGACLYMPEDGHWLHWLASFEVIPPPKSWFFRGQTSESSPLKTAVSDPKFWRFFFSANFVTLNSRILRTSRAPSRLIRPRPIDCNRGPEQPVKISRVWVRTSSFFFWVHDLVLIYTPKDHSRFFPVTGQCSRQKK